MCKHKTCQEIKENGGNIKGSAAVLPLVNYYGKGKHVALLGKEREGQHKGKYNLVSGKSDNNDGCYIETAMRELSEEFKINIVNSKQFDNYFRCEKDKTVRWFMFKGTPVFVGLFVGLKRNDLNNEIKKCHSNNIKWSLQEIEKVDFFTLEGNKIDDKVNKNNVVVSDFALAVLSKIDICFIIKKL